MDGEIANNFAQAPYEGKSGVRWNRVLPGFTFVQSAGIEAKQANPDYSLIRSLFITGLLFHLEALPADLSDSELSMIRAKAPAQLVSTPTSATVTATPAGSHSQCCHHNNTDQAPASPFLRSKLELLLRANGPQTHLGQKNRGPPSVSYPGVPSTNSPFIHRLTALFVIYVFLFFQFLLPYIGAGIHWIRRSERARGYMEVAVVLAVGAAQKVRSHGSTIGTRVMKMHDGRLASVVLQFIVWFSAAVLGGVCEGVGEGIGILNGIR